MATGSARQYDLIVIGAGINGAGIFREATTRGLKTLLVERGDLGGATSAASTRLIHGGLRYLEYYEFALVRESLRERERLLHTAPHLVQPLPLLLPLYRGQQHGPLIIGLGMVLYDILSYDKTLPTARMYTKQQALEREPGLAPDGLLAAARYYDAQATFPERLMVENVIDGVAHGGDVRLYTSAVGFEVEAGAVRGVRVRDERTGDEETVSGQVTMNVTGPWIDHVLALTGETFPRYNGGTKGSHLVVKPFPGAPKDALYIEARQDGRPYFIVPWNHLYLIGTTDLHYEGDLDRIVASDEEIEYLLKETNLAIPAANLTPDDVLYTFSGVRPLPYQPDASPGSITRKHIIQDHAPKLDNIFTIIGGKLTTYRSLSEEAVDAVEQKMGRTKTRSVTRKAMLPGGSANYEQDQAVLRRRRPKWLAPESLDWLLSVYGLLAKEVIDMAREDQSLRERITPDHPAIAAAIAYAFDYEYAVTLADVMLRRTMLALEADAGLTTVEPVSRIAARLQGWDEDRRRQEIAIFRDQIGQRRPRALEAQPV